MKQPRIGCVKYLNAWPLIRGWLGPVDFDHPAALCRKLSAGKLDLALVSSIEYLRRPEYRIVDGVSIAADGPVYSVFVTHVGDLSRVREIRADPASETSVALLRCLLTQSGLKARLMEAGAPATSRSRELTAASNHKAQLLIGDQAIRFRQRNPNAKVWDLAEEWKNLTDLPFVFALWLVRAEVANVAEIAERLRTLRDENLRRINELITAQKDFDPEFCARYFRDHLRFDFGEREKAGLREFHRLCSACGVEVGSAFQLNVV